MFKNSQMNKINIAVIREKEYKESQREKEANKSWSPVVVSLELINIKFQWHFNDKKGFDKTDSLIFVSLQGIHLRFLENPIFLFFKPP